MFDRLEWKERLGSFNSYSGNYLLAIQFRPNEMRNRDFDANEANRNLSEASTQEPLETMLIYLGHKFMKHKFILNIRIIIITRTLKKTRKKLSPKAPIVFTPSRRGDSSHASHNGPDAGPLDSCA